MDMISLADVCAKCSVPVKSLGDIPLNIPITTLQYHNNVNRQKQLAERANYTNDQMLESWIWGMCGTFIVTPAGCETKYFIEWNKEVYGFDLDSNIIRELVFNSIFYDEYHRVPESPI